MYPPRTPVALILASAASIALIMLVGAALFTTITSPEHVDLSPNYAATINSTLGVLIGSIATWVGATSPKQQSSLPAPRPPVGASPPPRTHGPRIDRGTPQQSNRGPRQGQLT